ncbi:hypothetical protein ANO11243_071010 [Dothideomycetidae sp. 11243]|nr:hypothetical protein ANO11243_071010 [fungal sp. No.11243]
MEFKFVSSNARDLKRKRPFGACEACKKRKKRCCHGEDDEDESGTSHDAWSSPWVTPNANTTNGTHKRHSVSTVDHAHPPSDSDSRSVSAERPPIPTKPSRFVGHTHAEANLELERDVPCERRDGDGVGVWVDSNDDEAESVSSQDKEADSALTKGPLLAEADKRAMVSIFLARVQPLLPILEADHTDIDKAVHMPETLAWAVCLVASKDQRAAQHRRLAGSTKSLPVSTFASRMHRSICRKIRNWRSFDRMALIRILTLISTHQEGPEGAEDASTHLSLAVHHAYSMGLHLKRVSVDAKTQQDAARLFWCIWSWDKVSSAQNGRPRMSYEMDIGLSFVDCLPLFNAPARLWMKVARLLSSVTDLYNPRPCVDTESHIKDFPRWEFLLEEEDTEGMDEGFLTTLELFYHSVSMLSCRIKLLVGRKRAFASSLRRNLSAATVYSISKCVPAEDLAPLPVVPYAYCLATLVAYQQYRCTEHQVHRKIAEEKLMHFQEQLQAMSAYWHAAKSMSRKTQRVLREFRRRNVAANASNHSGPNSDRIPTITTPSVAETSSSSLERAEQMTGTSIYNNTAKVPVQGLGYQDAALTDMDVTFGNLMDMNAFTGDIEFALTPYMASGGGAGGGVVGFDAGAQAPEGLWMASGGM